MGCLAAVLAAAHTLSAHALAAPAREPAPKPAAVKAQASAQSPALDQRVAAINGAAFVDGKPSVAMLLRAQAWLARAHFSPGAVDGRLGSNLSHVVEAYQYARNLPPSRVIDQATWERLSREPSSSAPVARAYTITAKDLAGPFAPDVGSDLIKLAALPSGPLYTTPLEALAARFHMTQDRLAALNLGIDFKTAGARIVVLDVAPPPFRKGDIASIRISKSAELVAAFDAQDRLIAAYPATVGSKERPSPSGLHKVVSVSLPASYVYDPSRLTWGPRTHAKFTIKPGPKGPIGTVWIALDAPTYGIHGSPKAEAIGKTASHGCVRLTNWDAENLATGVSRGVTVEFRGNRPAA
ncbi:MAG TPA: L,D-transpeptidase family protein [Caulobacteraceae bacterium]